jgi:Mn-dependent DtxR family transcriptional regulator
MITNNTHEFNISPDLKKWADDRIKEKQDRGKEIDDLIIYCYGKIKAVDIAKKLNVPMHTINNKISKLRNEGRL